jgi:predicted RNase H-like HicB family nuclease
MSEPVNDTLHIRVEYFTGREEEDDAGHPYYVASCDEIVAVTEGRTWNELMANIKEMLAAALDEEDTVAAYNLAPRPRIIITMELPENYAEIA